MRFRDENSSGNSFLAIESDSKQDDSVRKISFYLDQQTIGHKYSITPKSDQYIFRPQTFTFIFDGTRFFV